MTTPSTRRRPENLIVWGAIFIVFGAIIQLVLTDFPGWGFIAGGTLATVVGIAWSHYRRRPANGRTGDVP
ncbi:hypothetical protein FE374_03660 [Georgenia yuyongxinii]|uniref:DUF2530 domain-containing protein n=1 Tax=Georgenia yuyongxinii TaxID=2589797 RepID=A0A5B8C034_9MICO|nr:hypothetical protein [Georgenia yuyongxinii]QDC23848.1 hypothetical protein FE374_03660 [Georgenia yuyongxinii]